MDNAQLVALAAELTTSTHPITAVYNVDNILAAAELNDNNITQIRAQMTGQEIREAADPTEYSALTDIKKDQWLSYCSGSVMDPKAGGIDQQIVVDIFGGGSVTVTTLSTLRNETVSQSTLLGFGTVHEGHVAEARGQ